MYRFPDFCTAQRASGSSAPYTPLSCCFVYLTAIHIWCSYNYKCVILLYFFSYFSIRIVYGHLITACHPCHVPSHAPTGYDPPPPPPIILGSITDLTVLVEQRRLLCSGCHRGCWRHYTGGARAARHLSRRVGAVGVPADQRGSSHWQHICRVGTRHALHGGPYS